MLNRWLDRIDHWGKVWPEVPSLFIMLTLLVCALSFVGASLGWQAVHPVTGRLIEAHNLLSGDGVRYFFSEAVNNFARFPPLFTVLVAMLGVGLAEESGLLGKIMVGVAKAAPPKCLTPVIVFLGVMSNTAMVAGYVVLIPLAAMLFSASKRSPLLGIAAAFSGVSGGFSANLLVSTLDPMLAGITQKAAHLIEPAYQVSPLANYYFMAASTLLITLVGWWVTERCLAPRLEGVAWLEPEVEIVVEDEKASRRGMRWAGWTLLVFVFAIAALALPADGVLRDPVNGSLLSSPLLNGVVVLVMLFFMLPGLAYGLGSGRFQGEQGVYRAMARAIAKMAPYIVLVFFVAQFLAFFNTSQLGTLFALQGAAWLKAQALPMMPLLIALVLFSALINLFMGSSAAKWAILAPIFVPMFMLVGVSPELTQLAYRIGDSTTNLIAPLMVYYPMVLVALRRYKPDANPGTLVAMMLPYSLAFLLAWLGFMLLWLWLGLDLGPGVPSMLG
jgi:aminobenzoyl-glutamate transport protein